MAPVWFKRLAIVVKYSFSLHATSFKSFVSLLSKGKPLPVPFIFFAERMWCQIVRVSLWSVTDSEKCLYFALFISILVKFL